MSVLCYNFFHSSFCKKATVKTERFRMDVFAEKRGLDFGDRSTQQVFFYFFKFFIQNGITGYI